MLCLFCQPEIADGSRPDVPDGGLSAMSARCRRRLPLWLPVAAALLCIALWLGRALWLPSAEHSREELEQRWLSSLLLLDIYDGEGAYLTTVGGFAVGDGASVAIGLSAIAGAGQARVSATGEELLCVSAYDREAGLALLPLAQPLAPLELAAAGGPGPGQEATLAGCDSQSAELCLAPASVISCWQQGELTLLRLRTEPAICCGPVLDNEGRVIAVCVEEGLAVAADALAALLATTGEEIPLSQLGALLAAEAEPAEAEPAETGPADTGGTAGTEPAEVEAEPAEAEPSPSQPQSAPETQPSYQLQLSSASLAVAVGGAAEVTAYPDCVGANVFLTPISGGELFSQSYAWYDTYAAFTLYGEAPGVATLRLWYYPHNDASQTPVSRQLTLTVTE